MDFKRVAANAAVLLTMTSPLAGAVPADSSSIPAVVARTFDYAGVPESDLREAEARAGTILREAGIEVSWLACWRGGREPVNALPDCRQPLGPTDLILRVDSAKPGVSTQYVSLGFSLVNGVDGKDPYLATVYANLVGNVARGASVDRRELLGFAIAHEIGHLLLATNQHASTGLMRAAWSRAELRHNHSDDWQFLSGEAESMRMAIRDRSSR